MHFGLTLKTEDVGENVEFGVLYRVTLVGGAQSLEVQTCYFLDLKQPLNILSILLYFANLHQNIFCLFVSFVL